MQDPEQKSPGQKEDENLVEMTDLELPPPARHRLSFAVAQRILRWQRSLTRKQVRLAMGLGILLLVSLVLLFSVRSAFQAPPKVQKNISQPSMKNTNLPLDIKPAQVILPQQDGFACLEDTSWSQDSGYLAFVGYQKNCSVSNNLYEPGLVGVYAAQTGKLVEHFQPDAAILTALRSRYPELQGEPVIYYNHILWSARGRGACNLILTFVVNYQATRVNGVLLTDLHASDSRVWLHMQDNNTPFVEWDLQNGREVDAASLSAVSSSLPGNTPADLTYRWTADGSLIPQIEQIYEAQGGLLLPGPVGNPAGDATFTAWQPGQVGLTTQAGSGPPHQPGIFTWNSFFAALSPAGRYLIDGIFVAGRLELPGQPAPGPQTLKGLHLQQAPLLAVRDSGLQHILETLAGAPAGLSNQTLAWNPGGLFLASYDPGTVDLELFDCVTGYQVASLSLPPGASTTMPGHTNLLKWSPDGRQLLLFDPQLGRTLLWPWS